MSIPWGKLNLHEIFEIDKYCKTSKLKYDTCQSNVHSFENNLPLEKE